MASERDRFTYGESTPIRLDRLLAERFQRISRAFLQEVILSKKVSVNGVPARKGQMVRRGDAIEVEPFVRPEEREIEGNEKLPLAIVWQSPEILVVEKSAGLPTHPNDFSDLETLANALVARFPAIREVGEDPLRPGIVHRLDTDTSGLLLVARTQESFRFLRTLFDERKVRKAYLALVLGDVPEKGEVTTPLGHHPTNPRKMVAALPGRKVRSRTREAKTLYEPIERFGQYTLLRVRTLTGRMHQVRVHLSSIGHPLAGDRLYQTSAQRQIDGTGLKRHFLHATELGVPLPPSGEVKRFESPLPPELESALERLR